MTSKEYYDFREEENTRQVSLLSLLKGALKRWKIILLAGVILGCLLGSYKIFSIHSKKEAMIEDYDTYVSRRDAYRASIKEYKVMVKALQEQIEEKLSYMDSSIRMNLDAYNVPMATADFTVTSDKKLTSDQLAAIRTGLYNEVNFGTSIEEVAKKHDLSSTALRELITVKIATNGPTIRFTVRGTDEETAVSVREELIAELEKKRPELVKAFGEFTLKRFNDSVIVGYDSETFSFQEKQNDALTKLQTSAYTAQNQSNQLTKPVAVPQYSKKYMLAGGIKMGIVGLAGGIVLALAAVIASMISKGVIFSADEIDGEFGIRNLGDLSNTKLDKADEKLDYISAGIDNYVKDSKAKVAFIGQAEEGKVRELIDTLSKRIRSSAEFVYLPNVLSNADSLRKLPDADGVVLVEEIGKSDYMNARKEIAVAAESGSELIGTVYM